MPAPEPPALALPPRLILFDLDGTLVDSVPDLATAVNRTLDDLGLPGREESAIRAWVGNGIERLVKRALTEEMQGEPDASRFAAALASFRAHYAACNGQRSRLYPGVESALPALRAAGIGLACITNKAAEFSHQLLRALGIDRYFDLVIGGDSLPAQKPDPLPLLTAIRRFGLRNDQVLMVGDSVNDVRAARAAGLRIAAVPYGYNHGRHIAEAEPDWVVESLDRLQVLWQGRA